MSQEEVQKSGFEWRKVGTGFDISCLSNMPSGTTGLPGEVQENGDVHEPLANWPGSAFVASPNPRGNILDQTDVGVKWVAGPTTGLGLPWSYFMWHWGMIGVFAVLFGVLFVQTTPLDGATAMTGVLVDALGLPATFPWLTFVQKLMIFWYVWEALGLGVLHGPMHGKVAPPFTDWWYRLTPGTIKYRAPFMPSCFGNSRNILDVLVEGVLTYVIAFYILFQPEVTCTMMYPLFACSVYEFIFDYGQHLSTYGTQLMYVFACMCVPVEQGQLVGIQLFLTWFYFCSGWCKLGPWFKYLNVSNLMTAKFMVGTPWAALYRRLMFKDREGEDYNLTCFAEVFSRLCALLETLGPLLCLFSWRDDVVLAGISVRRDDVVLAGIFVFICMHVYIILTLIVDVFTWNFVDAVYYIVLFGVLRTGFDWDMISKIHPALAAFLAAHALYAIYGNFVPSHVPYVVAHRHAAGNFVQGMLMIKVEAAGKLAALKAHAGLPQAAPGWFGQWLPAHALLSYFWLWNMPSRMLTPLIHSVCKRDGKKYNDYVLIHSVLFFDALVAHVRFDGLSSLQLVEELGRVCGFEAGECTLCHAGSFQSFPISLTNCTAKWCIKDSKSGIVNEGLMSVSDLENETYKKPSDCKHLLDIIDKASKSKSDLEQQLLA
jgi:hypothetical protein